MSSCDVCRGAGKIYPHGEPRPCPECVRAITPRYACDMCCDSGGPDADGKYPCGSCLIAWPNAIPPNPAPGE